MILKPAKLVSTLIIPNKNKVIILLGMIYTSTALAQLPEKHNFSKNNNLLNNLSVEVSAGFTSYFGDLSAYDLNPVNKINHESLPAFSLRIGKSLFNNKFGFGGQLIYGGFKCDFDSQNGFKTKLFEYNLQFYMDITRIMYDDNDLKFGWKVYAGAGQFIFNISASAGFGELENESFYRAQVPEFVYFFGSTLLYNIHQNVSITVDLSTRQAQNDFLDLTRHGSDFDYYSYLGVGIAYNIGKLSGLLKKKQSCEAYDALHRKTIK